MNDICEKVSVKEIFEKKKTETELDKESVKEFGSAADYNGYGHRDIYPHHQEDNIDRICKEMHAHGKAYSDWQKEKYPVTVKFPWEP